jgi:hypothetical protein
MGFQHGCEDVKDNGTRQAVGSGAVDWIVVLWVVRPITDLNLVLIELQLTCWSRELLTKCHRTGGELANRTLAQNLSSHAG